MKYKIIAINHKTIKMRNSNQNQGNNYGMKINEKILFNKFLMYC